MRPGRCIADENCGWQGCPDARDRDGGAAGPTDRVGTGVGERGMDLWGRLGAVEIGWRNGGKRSEKRGHRRRHRRREAKRVKRKE